MEQSKQVNFLEKTYEYYRSYVYDEIAKLLFSSLASPSEQNRVITTSVIRHLATPHIIRVQSAVADLGIWMKLQDCLGINISPQNASNVFLHS